ncbi:MAG: ABC transporter permease [Gammaproteobacteria bacterium]|nr:ABC transporter permease [Gammaproteobacteria bacterium]MDE0247514.1 ABC transporter permease [Gammaproteobacteria bacterium]
MIDSHRLGAIARKEWIQLRRDPGSMILAFLLPIVLLLFFGYAINWDVREIPVAILDQDRSDASRELIQALVASGYFVPELYLDSARETGDQLSRGRVKGVLTIPPNYSSDLQARGQMPQVQLLLDGSDANTATIALNYADAIVARHATRLLPLGRDAVPPVTIETRTWYNPDLVSRHMIVPGLIAVIMSVIAAMLTALTIAREWERGTMEVLASTPVSRIEVVLGKLLPYLAIGLLDVAATVACGMAIFGTPMNGSIVLLAVYTVLFLTGALGLGIFISAAVKSQVLATQVAMLATYLPALLLSGFMFDIASMPRALQGVTFVVPARYFVTVTRGIFLKGVGPEVLWPQAILMAGFAALGLALATAVFRKELPT